MKNFGVDLKSQKGVTALSLVVVIVILLLILSSSLFSSKDLIVEANIATVYDEIATVKDAARKLKSLNELDPDKYKFSEMLMTPKITDISKYNDMVGQNLKDGEEYYYLGFNDDALSDSVKESIKEAMDLKSIDNNYIVNLKSIENVEVFLVGGVKIGDETCYTYEEIAAKYSSAIQQ